MFLWLFSLICGCSGCSGFCVFCEWLILFWTLFILQFLWVVGLVPLHYIFHGVNCLSAKHVICRFFWGPIHTQPAITCSKLTIKTLEQCVKYVQSKQQKHHNDVMCVSWHASGGQWFLCKYTQNMVSLLCPLSTHCDLPLWFVGLHMSELFIKYYNFRYILCDHLWKWDISAMIL